MIAEYFSRLSVILLALSLFVRVLTTPLQSNVQSLFPSGPQVRPYRVLLLTAHPDDECMFFAPTVTTLTTRAVFDTFDTADDIPVSEIFSLCLSVGDADGFGEVRKDELGRSLDVLGIEQSRRWLVDIPDLQDNITAFWDAETIANTVKPYVLENQIDTILTFDYEGVSSHPNHKSLPHGVAHLLRTADLDHAASVRAYSLISVPLIHKYIGPGAALLAKLDLTFRGMMHGSGSSAGTDIPVFVSSIMQYRPALRAMLQHKSQLVWFRWLYVALSRYMWVNEWAEILPFNATQTAPGSV